MKRLSKFLVELFKTIGMGIFQVVFVGLPTGIFLIATLLGVFYGIGCIHNLFYPELESPILTILKGEIIFMILLLSGLLIGGVYKLFTHCWEKVK